MSTDNQYDAPCGHCMTPETYEKHTEKAAYGKTDPKKVRLYELLAGVKSGAHTIKEAYDGILELGATRTPAPGVEEVDLSTRLRRKADMIGMGEKIAWGSETALMYEAAEALTTHQQEKEALVREILDANPHIENEDGSVYRDAMVGEYMARIKAIAARHGIVL